jgi:hypothetical protein
MQCHLQAVDPAPISEAVMHKLAQAFELTAQEVLTDAQQIVGWNEPGDDLLVSLERRHAWSAERALRYLVSVRSALAGELDAS